MSQALNLLGLCKKAGRLELGDTPCSQAVAEKNSRLVILASDISEGTRRRTEFFCEVHQARILSLPFTKDELGKIVGRKSVAQASITDAGLALSFVLSLQKEGIPVSEELIASFQEEKNRKPKKANRSSRKAH